MKIAVIVVLAALIFIYDLITPAGMGISLLYFIPFTLSGLFAGKKFSSILGIIVTAAIIFEYFYSPPGGLPFFGAINRSLTILVGWGILAVLTQRKTLLDEILRSRRSLEEKAAELAETNARLKGVFDSSPAAIVALDPEGKVMAWNPAAEEIFGYSAEEVIGHFYPLVPEGDDSFEKNFKETFQGRPLRNVEIARRRKDGKIIDTLVSSALLKDTEGKKYGTLVIFIDLTEKKQAEAVINELNERLLKLVEESTAGVFVFGSGKFKYVNRRFPEMLGYTKDEFARMDPLVVHPDDREKITEVYEKFFSGELNEKNFEMRALNKSGETVYLDVLTFRTDYMGSPAVIGTVIDITEKKRLEQERADFTAMVTHDLKSPLTTIIGYSDLLSDKNVDLRHNEAREIIKLIISSSEKMLKMVDDCLTVYGAESGKLKLNIMLESVADIMRELERDFSAQAIKKGMNIEFELRGMPKAELDRSQFTRAASNLIQNALNYTPKEGKVEVSLDASEQDFTVSVKDTGPGINPGDREKIFQKHYRAGGTAKTKGAGLGLAIAKAVAEAHGGRITLDSEPGRGSTFRLTIPLRQKEAAA